MPPNSLKDSNVGPQAKQRKKKKVGVTTLTRNQGKGLQGCESRRKPWITSQAPGSVGDCEGMNSHTPRWTPTLGVRIPVDSQIFKKRLQGLKPIGLKSSLYHWK